LYFDESQKQDKIDFKFIQSGGASVGGGGVGSNCWAFSGNHTESGKPLLACDPHLMKWQ